MAVQIPFPLPATGFALNSKVRVNLDFIVSKFNEFNTGTATWDAVYIGTGGSVNGALTLYNSTNGFYTTLQSGVATANQTYTWPTAVPASSGSLHSTNAGVLSWQQSVKTTDSPTFAGLTISGSSIKLSSFTSGGILYADGLGDLQQLGFDSGKVLTSGSASYTYSSLLGTTDQVTVTPSAGAFTFSTPQNIATTSTVDFARVRLNSAGSATTPELVIYKSPSATNTGLYSTGSDIRFATAGTYAGAFDGTDFAVVQDIRAGRYFILEGAGGNITLANGASGGSYTLTLPANDGDSGQALVTNGSGTLSWATPSGTGANTTLSNLTDTVAINKNLNDFSAGTITASLTGAASLNLLLTGGTLTGHLTMASTKNIVLTDGTTNTLTIAAPASVTSYTLTLPANDGDANQVLTTNGSGVTSWTTPAGTGANTALSNLASVAINANLIPTTDNTLQVGTITKAWEQIHAAAVVAGLSGREGIISVYPATASKGLTSFTASANSGDTQTTINTAAQGGVRTYTIPDAGASASFVMTEGTQTVNGSKTFGSPVLLPAGTISAPGLAFSAMTSTGLYTTAGTTLNIDVAGTQVCYTQTTFFAPAVKVLDGGGDGVTDIGGAANYFNGINYKTLTDRGCIPWCDDGVELLDGRKVSDLTALCSIEKHPTQLTIQGLPKLNYKTFPKKSWKPAEEDSNFVRRDENGVPWCHGPDGKGGTSTRPAEDGVEMTMMFGVFIGAFKELKGMFDGLNTRLDDLQKQIAVLKK